MVPSIVGQYTISSRAKEGFCRRKSRTAYIHSALAFRLWCGMHIPRCHPPPHFLLPISHLQDLLGNWLARVSQKRRSGMRSTRRGSRQALTRQLEATPRNWKEGREEAVVGMRQATAVVSWKAAGCISVSWNVTLRLATSSMCFLLADRPAHRSWIWPPFWILNRAATGFYFPKKTTQWQRCIVQRFEPLSFFWPNVVLLWAHKSLPTRDERGCHRNIQATGNTGVALDSSHYRRHFGVPVSLSPTSPRLFIFPFNLFQLCGAIAFLPGTALWGTRHQHCGGGQYSTQIKKGKKKNGFLW